MKTHLGRVCSLALIPLLLTGCSAPGLLGKPQLRASQINSIDSYDFAVSAGFRLSSVDDSDKDAVEQARQGFEADLRAGKTSDYQRDKDFSIHLLSGSEGNYFTSSELVKDSVSQVLATLVVVDANQQAQVFKGQYDSPRFVFADPSEQFALNERTKAYLLTAGSDFAIQTYKGELLPDDEAESTDSSQTSASDQVPAEDAAGEGYGVSVPAPGYGAGYGEYHHVERPYPVMPVYPGEVVHVPQHHVGPAPYFGGPGPDPAKLPMPNGFVPNRAAKDPFAESAAHVDQYGQYGQYEKLPPQPIHAPEPVKQPRVVGGFRAEKRFEPKPPLPGAQAHQPYYPDGVPYPKVQPYPGYEQGYEQAYAGEAYFGDPNDREYP